jgi:phenylpyruvate tautomerase PptA (4-oxalocrotonate tautomerase family)
MPIVTIHALPPSGPDAIAQIISDIRDSGARALRCSPDNIWVMFQPTLPQEQGHPPVVEVRAQSGRTPEQREAFVKAVAESVALGLRVSLERVWIHYLEMRPQDVWFEGRWSG